MKGKPIRFEYKTVSEIQKAAADCLPAIVNAYLESGAGKGSSMDNNSSAYNKWALVPRRLKGISDPDLSIEVFGQKYSIPFGAAPVGMQRLFHSEGELATVGACNHHKAPCILSTVSNLSFVEATISSKLKPWFQLYPTDNWDITKHLIKKAEKAGTEVIVLTVDVPVLGKRRHNARALLKLPEFNHLKFGNLEEVLKDGDNVHNPNMNWDLISLINENTKCKLVLKGIMHPEDAKLSIKNGVDGIIVSNHGGRQLDSCMSSLDALIKIQEVVPKNFPIFMDGGIRSAEDILKSLLLGAKMVFLGRPICYGLAIGGRLGVDHLWTILKEDLERNMKLMGIAELQSLDNSQICRI